MPHGRGIRAYMDVFTACLRDGLHSMSLTVNGTANEKNTPLKTSQQFFIFAGIGAIGTVGHYATLILLVQAIHTDPVFATTIGFIIGALINYVLNYRITFNSNKRHRETLTKFFSVASLGAVINGLIMSTGMNMFDVHYLIIQVIATCFVLVLNFTANKYWTFAD